MDVNEIIEKVLLSIFVLSISAMVIIVPLNFREKDKLEADLIQRCIVQHENTYLQCIERITDKYNSEKFNQTPDMKGY